MTAATQTPMPVVVVAPVAVPLANINGALLTAVEGGIGYWATITGYTKPRSIKFAWDLAASKKERRPLRLYRFADFPINAGGAVTVTDLDGKTLKLDMTAIKKGLVLTAKRYPKIFAKLVEQPDVCDFPDAGECDVFVQLCLLGKVVYG
jgi:hypothetical protein